MLRLTIALACLMSVVALAAHGQDTDPCPASAQDFSVEETSTPKRTAAVERTTGPDISGVWRLDRDLTTADLRWNKTDKIIVTQTGEKIRFDYFQDTHLLAADTFVTDWIERPRYQTRIERAYARARWDTDGLLIRTRSFLDAQGYQTYSIEDRWEVSDGGKTLTDKGSDGKLMVFYLISSARRR